MTDVMTDLNDRLRNALADFDLNTVPGQRFLPLDASTQENIKEWAVSAAIREIMVDLVYCRNVTNDPRDIHEQVQMVRERVAADGEDGLEFNEAVGIYRHAFALRTIGRRRLSGVAAIDRDVEIALCLRDLDGCGLPVSSWKSDQRTGEDLAGDQRRPSLAMALAEATGIGEMTIKAAWTKHSNIFGTD